MRSTSSPASTERDRAERFRSLAVRCRELSEITAIPEVVRELLGIAEELEHEAELAVER
jgi:hypothetical protein